MEITSDSMVFWKWGSLVLNGTILYTWVVMFILILISVLVTRNLKVEGKISRWQSFLETIVEVIRSQTKDILEEDPKPYIPFLGTLFLYISLSNLLSIVPLFHSPTSSFNTTAALAVCTFFAVPTYGIMKKGVSGYLKHYIRPTPVMLPFNIIGELSRTLALAIRLFGNIMSGTLIIGILLSLVPLFFPVILQVLELLIGQIQAYIFAVLAAVYIASAIKTQTGAPENSDNYSS
jgi:F-type H+-transporting ATPase subunit a